MRPKGIEKARRDQDGFTLVEVIVVCTMMAILAAVLIPSFIGYLEQSKAKECEANRKALVLQLSAARIRRPETTMSEILAGGDGKEITCPSGGVYSAADADTVVCSIHGKDAAAPGEAETVEKGEPDRPGDLPTEPETTPEEEESTEPQPTTPEEGLEVLGGSYRELYEYCKKYEFDRTVTLPAWSVFYDETGFICITNNTSFWSGAIKNKDEVSKLPRDNHGSMWVLDVDPILDSAERFEEQKHKVKTGSVAFYQGKYYAAGGSWVSWPPTGADWHELQSPGNWRPE